MSADVTFELQEYKDHSPQWEFVQKLYNGIDSARSLILQKPNEFDEDFDNRLSNSTLENFIERTVSAMSGEIMRKSLTAEGVPEATVTALQTINGHQNIDQFTKELIELSIRDGKAYVLADISTEGGNPYLSHIERSQLINWRKNDLGLFTMVVIAETYIVEDGRFGIDTKEQYRVIDEVGNVEIWRAGEDKKNNWFIYETITTSYNFCPFYELSISNVPPLYDIATINASHLNRSSQKDDYLTEALDPQMVFYGAGAGDDDVSGTGDKTDTPKVVLGIRSAIFIDDTEARVEWLEMSGANYEIAEKDLAQKSEAMAERALRLRNDSVKNESATSAMIENTEKQSRLTDIAEDAEITINSALSGWSRISNKEFVGMIIVNRDFNSVQMDSGLLSGLNALQISGNLSKETLLKALQKAEIVEIEDISEELRMIEDEMIEVEVVEDDRVSSQS